MALGRVDRTAITVTTADKTNKTPSRNNVLALIGSPIPKHAQSILIPSAYVRIMIAKNTPSSSVAPAAA